jgi:hypothetical protein
MAEDDKTPQTPNMLDLFKGMLEDHLGKAEFLKAFQNVISYVKKFEQRLTEDFDALANTVTAAASSIRTDFDRLSTQLKSQVNDVFVRERIDALTEEVNAKVDAKIEALRDGVDGAKGDKGDRGQAGRDGSPDTPAQVRDKLEALKGKDRLNISAIAGFDEFEKTLRTDFGRITSGRITSGPNANAIQVIDLTSQCNGVTKTFSVPRHRVALSLSSTQFPVIYRPVIDYTTANMTLTLTDQVAAPETGQTLLFVYIK